MRAGTEEISSKLVRAKRIEERRNGKCLNCGKLDKDNYKHWALECESFGDIRHECLDLIIRLAMALEDEDKENKVLSILLNGKLKSKIPKSLLDKEDTKIDIFNETLAR